MCVSKSIGLAYIAERNFTIFALVYLYFRAISKHNPPGGGGGGLLLRGAFFWRVFFRYKFGGSYLEGLIHAGAYFGNFTV